jgi:hypothetical protein
MASTPAGAGTCAVANGRSLDGVNRRERRSFDLLADKESNHAEHTNTSVGELGLARLRVFSSAFGEKPRGSKNGARAPAIYVIGILRRK